MKKAIRIKMAEAEGYDTDPHPFAPARKRLNIKGEPVPTYDNDNDPDRFIRGMDEETLDQYRIELRRTLFFGEGNIRVGELQNAILQATVEQKQEGIIAAMGWEATS